MVKIKHIYNQNLKKAPKKNLGNQLKVKQPGWTEGGFRRMISAKAFWPPKRKLVNNRHQICSNLIKKQNTLSTELAVKHRTCWKEVRNEQPDKKRRENHQDSLITRKSIKIFLFAGVCLFLSRCTLNTHLATCRKWSGFGGNKKTTWNFGS